MPDPPASWEVHVDDHVLRLDGTVVDVLHRSGTAFRWHVAHLAVEAQERGDELRLRLGVDAGGSIVGGTRITVPGGRRDAVMALFAEARRRRDAPEERGSVAELVDAALRPADQPFPTQRDAMRIQALEAAVRALAAELDRRGA